MVGIEDERRLAIADQGGQPRLALDVGKPGQILALVKAWNAAVGQYRSNPGPSQAIITKAVGASPGSLKTAFAGVKIYNVADAEPTQARSYADQVAAELGVPAPPTVPPDASSPAARELLGGDRRVRNRRLIEELGVDLAYPTWREAFDVASREVAFQRHLDEVLP